MTIFALTKEDLARARKQRHWKVSLESVDEVLRKYDAEKGFWRRFFWDHPMIRVLRKLSRKAVRENQKTLNLIDALHQMLPKGSFLNNYDSFYQAHGRALGGLIRDFLKSKAIRKPQWAGEPESFKDILNPLSKILFWANTPETANLSEDLFKSFLGSAGDLAYYYTEAHHEYPEDKVGDYDTVHHNQYMVDTFKSNLRLIAEFSQHPEYYEKLKGFFKQAHYWNGEKVEVIKAFCHDRNQPLNQMKFGDLLNALARPEGVSQVFEKLSAFPGLVVSKNTRDCLLKAAAVNTRPYRFPAQVDLIERFFSQKLTYSHLSQLTARETNWGDDLVRVRELLKDCRSLSKDDLDFMFSLKKPYQYVQNMLDMLGSARNLGLKEYVLPSLPSFLEKRFLAHGIKRVERLSSSPQSQSASGATLFWADLKQGAIQKARLNDNIGIRMPFL